MIEPRMFYQLASWLSPGFPVGAYSHSNGLEWAVQQQLVSSRPTLTAWLEKLVANGGTRSDAVLLAHSHSAAGACDQNRLLQLAELGSALHPSRERQLESVAQGAAFRRVASVAAPCSAFAMLEILQDDEIPYPVVVGAVAAGHGIPVFMTLTAFLHAVVSNLVSAAQRLISLGQTDAQLVIAQLSNPVITLAEWAASNCEGDPFHLIGSGTLMADLASLAHETQHTRLFRT
jgi:urease accessory protein